MVSYPATSKLRTIIRNKESSFVAYRVFDDAETNCAHLKRLTDETSHCN